MSSEFKITQSFGYLFLSNIKKDINDEKFIKTGSIIKMNNVIDNIFSKLDIMEQNKESAEEVAYYCLNIQENILPGIMNGRILTYNNTKVYTDVYKGCFYLIEDLKKLYVDFD